MTVPSAANTGRSAASRSRLVSARGPSSAMTVAVATGTGDQLAVEPAGLLRGDRLRGGCARAKRSCASRLIEYSAASTSAVMPRLIVCSVRHPRVDQAPAERGVDELLGPRQPVGGPGSTNGARLIASTPPATPTSPWPRARSAAARLSASRPDPHSRLTVAPGTDQAGRRGAPAIRATLRLSSPAWLAAPHTTSEISVRVEPGCGRDRPARGRRGRRAARR